MKFTDTDSMEWDIFWDVFLNVHLYVHWQVYCELEDYFIEQIFNQISSTKPKIIQTIIQ